MGYADATKMNSSNIHESRVHYKTLENNILVKTLVAFVRLSWYNLLHIHKLFYYFRFEAKVIKFLLFFILFNYVIAYAFLTESKIKR